MDEKLLQKLKEMKKIKTLEDAFKDYPPEEYWPDNILEKYYLIKEPVFKSSKYEEGDIVFVKEFEYENKTKGHNHLFVIFGDDGYVIPSEYFAMILTSKIHKAKYKDNYYIKKNENNGLIKDGVIKTDVIYEISEENIIGKIGKIDECQMNKFKEIYEKLFFCEIK